MKVEIWSDIVCPFCYIGKRQFELALGEFEHREAVGVAFKSFELDPKAPGQASYSLEEMLARKYGTTLEQARVMNERVTAMAESVGLKYDLGHARPSNSFDGHRLVHAAKDRGLDRAMIERLYAAYFSEAVSISDRKSLVRLAEEVGIEGPWAAEVLDQGAYADQVRADEEEAQGLGITGVPFFVFDRTYAVSGAQGAQALLEVLRKAWEAESSKKS